jgi:hypothetical protein
MYDSCMASNRTAGHHLMDGHVPMEPSKLRYSHISSWPLLFLPSCLKSQNIDAVKLSD